MYYNIISLVIVLSNEEIKIVGDRLQNILQDKENFKHFN